MCPCQEWDHTEGRTNQTGPARTTGVGLGLAREPWVTGPTRATTDTARPGLRCRRPLRSRSPARTEKVAVHESHPGGLSLPGNACAPRGRFRTSRDLAAP